MRHEYREKLGKANYDAFYTYRDWEDASSNIQWDCMQGAEAVATQVVKDILAAFDAHASRSTWVDREVLVRRFAAEHDIDPNK